MATLILLFVAFIMLSGLMAAVDAAVLSVTQPEVEELIQLQRYGSKRLSQVKRRIRDSVVVIVIATNTINVLGPVLVSHWAFTLYDSQAAGEVQDSEFSRYPIFGATIDEVQGILLARDLFRAIIRGDSQESVLSLAVEPLVVDPEYRSDDLLTMFRDQHVHLAVVQSAGRTLGIVTLEDVLEQLVGAIDDEKDVSAG
ncbi:Magnesium and cobalt efflux protein CorC [Rhodopirellula islandica]|uniref:Magnesium and cobalt efflux protein CorC n=1 Tax=Rhodopirellula islandica TaxID=595434 RepID=A0A0J1BGK3_RHOIS|nr:DUF21 domain-containing protein [Rhodopirellula islandica]KLU05651.1 Magnesium and cobalt efflux protein CorC [Rhodopirellula islandica]